MDSMRLRNNSAGYSRTLCLASPEIGRALAAREAVTFRAQGTCMYPTIRPGDILQVEPCSLSEICVGDIAVCHGGTYLFGHRVIAVGNQDGCDYLITKPDSTRRGHDAPVCEDHLVGVVKRVERGGKSIDLGLHDEAHSLAERAMHRFSLSMINAKLWVKVGVMRMVESLQSLGLYGYFGDAWFRSQRRKIRFIVQVPPSLALRGVAHCLFELDAFDPCNSWGDRVVDCWTISAFLGEDSVAAGTVTAGKTQAGSWEIDEPLVRVRYRGTGLDQLLVEEAERLVDRSRTCNPSNVH